MSEHIDSLLQLSLVPHNKKLVSVTLKSARGSSRDPVLPVTTSSLEVHGYWRCFSVVLGFFGGLELHPGSKPQLQHRPESCGVGGCEQSQITALHQDISPFTLFTSMGRRSRAKETEGGGEVRATKAKRKNRGERRWGEWCCLSEAMNEIFICAAEETRSLSHIFFTLLLALSPASFTPVYTFKTPLSHFLVFSEALCLHLISPCIFFSSFLSYPSFHLF